MISWNLSQTISTVLSSLTSSPANSVTLIVDFSLLTPTILSGRKQSSAVLKTTTTTKTSRAVQMTSLSILPWQSATYFTGIPLTSLVGPYLPWRRNSSEVMSIVAMIQITISLEKDVARRSTSIKAPDLTVSRSSINCLIWPSARSWITSKIALSVKMQPLTSPMETAVSLENIGRIRVQPWLANQSLIPNARLLYGTLRRDTTNARNVI